MNKLLSFVFVSLVACVTTPVLAQDAQGDAKAGEKKIAMCIGCHGIIGYKASFPEVHRVPMISGQSAKYIASALNAYKKGERKHPTMRGIADSLSDQDIADVSAYYSTHGGEQAAPEAAKEATGPVAELLKKGACNSCHGANFSKPIDPSYPKLAGQHADYLTVALKSYKAEHSGTVGRSNAIMAGQIKQFSNAELKAIAGYIGALPTELATVPQSKFR